MLTQIGKYKIEGEIGRGGFGQVYRAFDPSVGRAVAIKVLNPGADASLLGRFRNEAVTAGNLQHRHIVTVYEFGEHDGLAYLVMEFLEGRDLQRVIQEGGPGSLLQKVQIMSQVASGLHSAHVHGVVHRDVKPANIMLLPDGNVKIMDFGIARLSGARNPNRTQTGIMLGSVRYMSPEQFGGGPIDALCDIWGYGVVYYELISGCHPFPVTELAAAMYHIQSVEPQPLRTIAPACPPALEDIITRALAKDRDLRYQSLEDLRIDAEPILLALQREEAGKLVKQAQELAGRNEWENVKPLVKQILELDSINHVGRQLREEIRQRTQRQALRLRTEALIKEGTEQLATGDYQAAVGAFEAAQRLDASDPSIGTRLAEARAKSQRIAKAAELVRAARVDLEARNLTSALERASEALRIDPDNKDAIATLSAVRAEQPGGDPEQEQQRLRAVLDASRASLKVGSPSEAVTRLQAAVKEFPEDRELQQLLSNAQQRLQARRLIEAHDYDAAMRAIEIALQAHPGDTGLMALMQSAQNGKAAQEKEAAITDALRRAEALARQNRAPEALEIVLRAVHLYSDDPRLPAIRDRLSAYLRKQERSTTVRKAIAQAQDLSKAGDVEAALALLESNLPHFPDSEELRRACDAARNEKASQDEQRGAVERARRLEQNDQWAAALGVITTALLAHPNSESLRAYETRLRQRMPEEDRRYAAARERAEIEELLNGRRYTEARDRVERARNANPGDESLQQLHERVQSHIREVCDRYASRIREALDAGGLDEAEELLTDVLRVLSGENAITKLRGDIDRERQFRELILKAGQQLEHGELDNAERSAQQALGSKKDDPLAKEILSEIGQRRTAQDRKRRIDHARKSARELLGARRFNDARKFLKAAIQSFPDVADFHTDLAEVDAAQQHYEGSEGKPRSTSV